MQNDLEESDLCRLEKAVEQISEVENFLREQERAGRLLVWLPGLLLLVLVSIDLTRHNSSLIDWFFIFGFSFGLCFLLPLKRKWEIDATKAWLSILQEAQRIVSRSRENIVE